jgi:hypothetical protein
MSATTEIITEQLHKLKEQIDTGRKNGQDVGALISRYDALSKQLTAAASALNESKQILKG